MRVSCKTKIFDMNRFVVYMGVQVFLFFALSAGFLVDADDINTVRQNFTNSNPFLKWPLKFRTQKIGQQCKNGVQFWYKIEQCRRDKFDWNWWSFNCISGCRWFILLFVKEENVKNQCGGSWVTQIAAQQNATSPIQLIDEY